MHTLVPGTSKLLVKPFFSHLCEQIQFKTIKPLPFNFIIVGIVVYTCMCMCVYVCVSGEAGSEDGCQGVKARTSHMPGRCSDISYPTDNFALLLNNSH